MTKLKPILNSIFYILISVSFLTSSFHAFGDYIFDENFNAYGAENRAIIVFLIVACLFIAFSIGLGIYELIKFIKKDKPLNTFGLFAISFGIALISFTSTFFLFTESFVSLILILIAAILVGLPYVIKLFDKKDLLDLPIWLYVVSDIAILFGVALPGIGIAMRGFSCDFSMALSGEEISYLVFGVIGIITIIYSLFYIGRKIITEDNER